MPHPLIAKFASKFSGPRGPSRCIGLDAGTSTVRGVQLHRTGGQVEILQAETEDLSPGLDAVQRAEAVQRLAQKLGCPEVPLVAAVGGPGTVLRRVSFPKMTSSELKAALTFEAEKHIPFKLDEVFFDFSIQGDRGSGQMDVILAAARRELVQELVELLAPCGAPLAVDLEMAALANAWEAVPAAGGEGVTGLIHIGDRGTVLDFIRGSQLEFAREITLRPVLQPSWEEWLSQCRSSFEFYEDQFGRRVEQLVLSGGGACMAGFREWVQETSGLPVQAWDPLAGVPGSEQAGTAEARGALAVAVGSALRGFQP